MPRDVRRPTNYRAAINLYVEDRATEAYLAELWRDPSIAFFLGGGNEGVDAIARVEQKAGHPNVFGVIDRDFRQSNRDKWLDIRSTFAVFVLPAHEIENYMLDASALGSSRYHDRGLPAVDIEAFMIGEASRLCWWEACRDVMAELKRRFRDGFINDPPRSIDEIDSARRHIRDSPWFAKLATEVARSTEADVDQLLAEAHARATASLRDGSWRENSSGKEILKDVSSRICHRPPRFAEIHEDLAKDVAAWQSENDEVPPDLVELHGALKTRVARS